MTSTITDAFVDIDIVRSHIHRLKASGLTGRDIARISGYGDDYVSKLSRYRAYQKVTRNVAEIFLAIEPQPSIGYYIDGTGTRRRLEALAVIGWGLPAIASRYGATPTQIWRTRSRDRVTQATAQLIDSIYQQLSTEPGGDVRTMRIAARNGWHPPTAWDDNTIDDPAVEPITNDRIVDEIAVVRALAGDDAVARKLTDSEKQTAIRIGTSRGMTRNTLARLLHVNQRTVLATIEAAA